MDECGTQRDETMSTGGAAATMAAGAPEGWDSLTHPTVNATDAEAPPRTAEDRLVEELDRNYQRVLDVLERETHSTMRINSSLRRALAQRSETPVLMMSAERAISPHEAYRQLGERLVEHERSSLDPDGTQAGVQYDDLFAWHDEPPRGMLSPEEHFLARLEYARSKSFRALRDQLVLRFNPEAVPGEARRHANEALLELFGLPSGSLFLLPLRQRQEGVSLFLPLLRQEQEMPWHLSAAHTDKLNRAFHAIATLTALGGLRGLAARIHETRGTVQERLKNDLRQYHQGDFYRAEGALVLFLRRDTLEYLLAPGVAEVVLDVVRAETTGLDIVKI